MADNESSLEKLSKEIELAVKPLSFTEFEKRNWERHLNKQGGLNHDELKKSYQKYLEFKQEQRERLIRETNDIEETLSKIC